MARRSVPSVLLPTREQIERLVEVACNTRYGLFFELLVNAGLRRGEALALKWRSHVKGDDGRLEIRSTLVRKNGDLVTTSTTASTSRREVPITARTASASDDVGAAAWARAASNRTRFRLGGEENPPVEPVVDSAWPPPAVWDDITELNTGLAYRLVRLLQDRLVDGASITHISSIAATMPWVRSSTRWVADHVLRAQVDDGATRTKEQLLADVAEAVVFLASSRGRQLTGQFLDVDGGASLVRAAR